MKLSNKIYDFLKFIAQYLLPVLGSMYFTLAKAGFELPYVNEIIGIITALDTLLGMVLGLSKHSYNGEGTLVIDKSDEETDKYRLDIGIPLEELSDRKSITLKVDPNGSVG